MAKPASAAVTSAAYNPAEYTRFLELRKEYKVLRAKYKNMMLPRAEIALADPNFEPNVSRPALDCPVCGGDVYKNRVTTANGLYACVDCDALWHICEKRRGHVTVGTRRQPPQCINCPP